MALDYGSKTVGIAISDTLGLTAQPIETIYRKEENKLRKTCARIEALIQKYQVEKIILGKPLHMNDTEGERVEKCRIFKEILERRTGLEVIWRDERLTTVEANDILAETGVKKEDRKKYIDQISAVIILEEYMRLLENNARK